MSSDIRARIPCSESTHERLRDLKRDGMTYETLLRQMLAQYDPEDAP